jgi:hypothetical protein
MNAVETYTKTLLAPRLRKYGLNKDQREKVCADVRQRLASLLSHWSEVPFRRAILMLGIEEATFWEPKEASIDVRALVVLGVRNSQIESLNAATRSKNQVLPDEEMPDLTREAIAFFQSVELTHPPVPKNLDVFGVLPEQFPNAWQALSALANLTGADATFELRLGTAKSLDKLGGKGHLAGTTVVSGDGMDANLDPGLRRILTDIQRGELREFHCPSFTRLTRNPSKFLAILDHLLRHGAALVMPNYALTPSYVARRQPLVRPPHDIDEAERNLANRNGLALGHQALLGLSPLPERVTQNGAPARLA